MNSLRFSNSLRTAALALTAGPTFAGVNMAPLTGFSGDGWLAPGEGGYAYMTAVTSPTERGIAYNAATDHLILVSRTGPSVRLIDASNGEDAGELPNPGGYIGTFFPVNMAGVGDDGAIYVANLQTNISTGNFRVYRWESQTSPQPTIYFDSTIPGFATTTRVGDSFDVIGSGLDTKLVTGFSAASTGYLVLSAEAGALPEDPPVVTATPVINFTPSGIAAGDFRLGITFGKDGADHVWGRQTSGTAARRSTYSGATGIYSGSLPFGATNEVAMDVATVGGRPLLAVLNVNTAGTGSPTVRVYDVTDPASPSLAASGTTTTGLTATNANSNGVGSIKWGKISTTATETTATLYALAANQGIQAFTVTVTPEVTAPAIVTEPLSRSVFERGIASFTVSASGTPPLAYQWLKGVDEIPGATGSTLVIKPVTSASAGDYICRVSNASPTTAESAAATLTVVPSVNSTALTELWHLSPASRPYISEGDTQRGLDCNPAATRLYLASRTPAAGIHILNAADGADLGELDMTGVSGGTFALMHTCVGDDGVIWACNLSSTGDGSGFKIYQWPDDAPATAPATTYDGNPIGSRIGDSFNVRGSGAGTQCVAGARNTNQIVVFTVDAGGFLIANPVAITGADDGAFGLGVAFGQGDTVWGKNNGGGVTLASFDISAGTGAVVATFPTTVVPGAGGAIAVDSANGCLAHIHTGDSDNVRLYRVPVPFPDPPPATLELLDQEFFNTDNPNANNVGAIAFGGGKLFALDTNNGLAAYTVAKPLPPSAPPVITDIARNGNDVVFKLRGTAGKTYLIEKSTQLDPIATWTPDGTVNQIAVEETVTRAIPPGTPRLYWRAREQ